MCRTPSLVRLCFFLCDRQALVLPRNPGNLHYRLATRRVDIYSRTLRHKVSVPQVSWWAFRCRKVVDRRAAALACGAFKTGRGGCTSLPGAPRSNRRVLAMTRPAVIPPGSWPRRMGAELAAGYCGESTVEAFIKRVGSDYPQPRITEGRRRLWLRDDLDQAILPPDLHRVRDVAEDL
jgi:hypothetical protein